jgi:hypothetical protein
MVACSWVFPVGKGTSMKTGVSIVLSYNQATPSEGWQTEKNVMYFKHKYIVVIGHKVCQVYHYSSSYHISTFCIEYALYKMYMYNYVELQPA